MHEFFSLYLPVFKILIFHLLLKVSSEALLLLNYHYKLSNPQQSFSYWYLVCPIFGSEASSSWFLCAFDTEWLCQDTTGSLCAFHAGDMASAAFLKDSGSLSEFGFFFFFNLENFLLSLLHSESYITVFSVFYSFSLKLTLYFITSPVLPLQLSDISCQVLKHLHLGISSTLEISGSLYLTLS